MWENIAAYRGAQREFSQTAAINSNTVKLVLQADGNLKADNFEVKMEICLAYSLAWIRNKALPMAQRVRGAAGRMANFNDPMTAVAAMREQANLNRLWDWHGDDLKEFLEIPEVRAPKPIAVIVPDASFSETSFIVAFALETHTPYLMTYSWPNAGHAIVVYRTMHRTIVFDPNCGEFACPGAETEAMWEAYDRDLKTLAIGAPKKYSLASVGVTHRQNANNNNNNHG